MELYKYKPYTTGKIMKKILVFLIIIALIAVCWVLFFSDFDFDNAQSTLVDNNYTVSNITGSQLVEDGIFTGSLAKYASSIGGVMVAMSVDADDITNSDVLVALEITDMSIITSLASDILSSNSSDLVDDIDIDALRELSDSYPELSIVLDDLSSLSDSEREQLLDSLDYSIAGSTLLIGTSSALSLVK